MTRGTKSLIFGVHQFAWHPITVWLAWVWLYRTPPTWRECVCILVHDWGYWGCKAMDDERGDLDLCGDRRPPSVATSETSREAASDFPPDLIAKARMAVYRYLETREARGATDEEMQAGIPMAANTQRPRRRELEQSGLVVDSEQRRETKSGRRAVVWALRSAAEGE